MAEKHPNPAQEVPRELAVKPTGKIAVVLAVVAAISLGIVFMTGKLVSDKRAEQLIHVQKRLELLADGRKGVIDAWLTNLSHQGDRLIKSDLFRLYASEVDMYKGDLASIFGGMGETAPEDMADIAAQLPMMQNMLREFSTYSGFLAARVLNRSGLAYIATDGHLPPLSVTQTRIAQQAMESGRSAFSPLRKTQYGLELDVCVPMFPPDAGGNTGKAVGALMMTRQVTGKITELLSNSALSAEGEHTRLMQAEDGKYREVTPWTAEGFVGVTARLDFSDDGHLVFGERACLADCDKPVYSFGAKVPGVDWWVVQEIGAKAALADFARYERTAYFLAGFAVLTIFLLAGLAWWILAGVQTKKVAEKFRDLAEEIENQKRLIDSINAAVDEFISLKNLEGKYIYVNDAFARTIGRTKEEMVGMDNAAIFGFDTGQRLQASDDKVIATGQPVTSRETIFIHSKRHDFLVSKSPYTDVQNKVVGVVAVFRDVTEYVSVQEKNKRLVQRAMEALVSTIEAADPYLGGHSHVLAGLSREVAKRMDLSEMDIVEVETAANLSQIGKVFVPKEILSKPGALTPDEIKVMEQHVEHAYRILKDIDMGEGVLQAIYQMNERLDGTGYPKKLEGEDIILPARILAAGNVFCAMIRPRAYRGAKTPEKALEILSSESHRFDPAVVEALRTVVSSPAGEKILKHDD